MVAGGASAQGSRHSAHHGLTAAQRAALAKTNRKIHSYTKLAWHWDDVLGRPHMRFGYRLGSSTSLSYVHQFVLRKRMAAAQRLHQQAKRLMVKRTNVYLAHISQLQAELGMTKPERQLADAAGIEVRLIWARRLDRKLTTEWQSSGMPNALGCIHHGEGAWNSVSNSTPTYYGGLQMDLTFQKQYGPEFLAKWGTADHWPIWAQMTAASRAVKGWDGPDPKSHKARGFHPWPNTAHNCGLL